MPLARSTIIRFIAESNRIEGIDRAPTAAEIAEHKCFMALSEVSVAALERFVSIYQPGARLRDAEGMNVRVGDYLPPPGGPRICVLLQNLLDDCNQSLTSPWSAHLSYEMLHPFTDGNGRSGRALWYWMMRGHEMHKLGFLHAFYYQTLERHQSLK